MYYVVTTDDVADAAFAAKAAHLVHHNISAIAALYSIFFQVHALQLGMKMIVWNLFITLAFDEHSTYLTPTQCKLILISVSACALHRIFGGRG